MILELVIPPRARVALLAELVLATSVAPVVLRLSVREEFRPTSFGGCVFEESGRGWGRSVLVLVVTGLFVTVRCVFL